MSEVSSKSRNEMSAYGGNGGEYIFSIPENSSSRLEKTMNKKKKINLLKFALKGEERRGGEGEGRRTAVD